MERRGWGIWQQETVEEKGGKIRAGVRDVAAGIYRSRSRERRAGERELRDIAAGSYRSRRCEKPVLEREREKERERERERAAGKEQKGVLREEG